VRVTRASFRNELRAFRPMLGIGVHNPLTAALASAAGVDLLWLSSFEVSASRMLPDANVMGFGDLVPLVRDIAVASDRPILVDADNGYGSDQAARLAAIHFDSAGAAGLCIEDNAFPKRNSFLGAGRRQLTDRAEACRRIAAARTGSDRLAIVARTEALVAGLGAAEAVHRVRGFVDAGADAVFVQTRAESLLEYQQAIEEIRGLVPVVLTPTALPDRTPDQLHAIGIDVVIHANVVVRTLVRSLQRVLGRVSQGCCLREIDAEVEPMSTILEMTHQGWPLGDDPALSANRARQR